MNDPTLIPPRDLAYHGRPLHFPAIVLVHGLTPSGPFESPEPPEVESILTILRARYTALVAIEPGDGTRYGLLLSFGGRAPSFALYLARVEGGPSVRIDLERAMTTEDMRPLANGNDWTAACLAWWANELRRSLLT